MRSTNDTSFKHSAITRRAGHASDERKGSSVERGSSTEQRRGTRKSAMGARVPSAPVMPSRLYLELVKLPADFHLVEFDAWALRRSTGVRFVA